MSLTFSRLKNFLVCIRELMFLATSKSLIEQEVYLNRLTHINFQPFSRENIIKLYTSGYF